MPVLFNKTGYLDHEKNVYPFGLPDFIDPLDEC